MPDISGNWDNYPPGDEELKLERRLIKADEKLRKARITRREKKVEGLLKLMGFCPNGNKLDFPEGFEFNVNDSEGKVEGPIAMIRSIRSSEVAGIYLTKRDHFKMFYGGQSFDFHKGMDESILHSLNDAYIFADYLKSRGISYAENVSRDEVSELLEREQKRVSNLLIKIGELRERYSGELMLEGLEKDIRES